MKRFKHAYLLAALVLIVFVKPLLPSGLIVNLMDYLLVVGLAFAVWVCSTGLRSFLGFLAISVITIGLGVAWRLSEDLDVGVAFSGAAAVCGVWAVVAILRSMFRTRRVTPDTIYASLSVYLLLGIVWSFLYVIQEWGTPGSFTPLPEGLQGFERFVGFSFVTLTTLGYGNISPANPRADALCAAEAMIGQIYLTVLVARLVGLRISQASTEKEE